MSTTNTRRRLLRACSGVGAAVLAGCFGSDDEADESETEHEDGEEDGDGDGDDSDDGSGDDEPSYPTPVDWSDEERGTVVVGPDENYASFDPDSVRVRPGTTVRFLWGSSGHNISVKRQPDDADWAGVADTRDEGHEVEVSFVVEGVYEYQCDPHADSGMVGYVVVDAE